METELYQTAPEPADEVTVSFKMEKGIHARLENLAEKRGVSTEGLLHSLVKAELEKEEKQ